jgi:hypothetical protein
VEPQTVPRGVGVRPDRELVLVLGDLFHHTQVGALERRVELRFCGGATARARRVFIIRETRGWEDSSDSRRPREGRRTLGFSFPTDACRASERAGWGREDARTFKTPLVSEDASAAASLSVAGDTGGCAYALGMELEGGGGANDMIDARLGPCDERSRPRRARGPASADAVSRSSSGTRATERTTPRSTARVPPARRGEAPARGGDARDAMPRLSVKTPSRRLSVSCADAFPKTRSKFAVSRRREHPLKSRRAFREKHPQKTS